MADSSFSTTENSRLLVLDGWRGVSILLILATHFFPIGPKVLGLSEITGTVGMTIFLTLSGFLITNILLSDDRIANFLVRRVLRIVPLAWLYLAITMPITGGALERYVATFLFYANLPPFWLTFPYTAHFWSLCVEMQFYVGIACLVAMFRRNWPFLIPLLCVGFTVLRVIDGAHVSIVTFRRDDEILAGSILALIYRDRLGAALPRLFRGRGMAWIATFGVLALASAHPVSGPLNYLRPYLVATVVGLTLYNNQTSVYRMLDTNVLRYIATISYALYVVHPALAQTWLGSGEGLSKYAKRPLLFAAIFLTAHLSTFYYERRFNDWGRKITGDKRQEIAGELLRANQQNP